MVLLNHGYMKIGIKNIRDNSSKSQQKILIKYVENY